MTIALTPQLEALIAEKIASGRYQSASEVIREALRLLEESERLEAIKLTALQRDIQAGLDSGEPVPFDKDTIRKLADQKH
jgi:antitoxin ParD1/3/4